MTSVSPVAHQRLQDEVNGLLGAAGDQHIIVAALDADGAHIIAHSDAQRQVAFRHFVRKGIRPIALNDMIDGVLHVAHGKELFGRRTVAEVDDARFSRQAHHLADGCGAARCRLMWAFYQVGDRRPSALAGDEGSAAGARA